MSRSLGTTIERLKGVGLLTGGLLAVSTPGEAQILVTGTITEELSGRPIMEADVVLTDSLQRSVGLGITDDDGRFGILHPGAGTYELSVERIGYMPSYAYVTLHHDTPADIEFSILLQPVELDPVQVVAEQRRAALTLGLDGFVARMELNLGDFIVRDEIERRRPSYVSDLFAGAPGVRMVGGGRTLDIRFMGTERLGGQQCAPSIWVDGRIARQGGDRGIEDTLDDVAPPAAMIGAVEIYRRPAGIPPQFNMDGACGVIVIWTRR